MVVRIRTGSKDEVFGFDRMVKEFFDGGSVPLHAEGPWRPPMDVYETHTDVVVRLEIAGIQREELSLTYDKGVLMIRGYREERSSEPKMNFRQMEIHYGPFERAIRVSDQVDADRISAHYRDGLLEIRLPKMAPKTKSIPIKRE